MLQTRLIYIFLLTRPGCRCCLLDSNPRPDMPKTRDSV